MFIIFHSCFLFKLIDLKLICFICCSLYTISGLSIYYIIYTDIAFAKEIGNQNPRKCFSYLYKLSKC